MGLLKWIKDLAKNKKIKPAYVSTQNEYFIGGGSSTASAIQWTSTVVSEPDRPHDGTTPVVNTTKDERIVVKPKDVVDNLLGNESDVKLDFTNLKKKLTVVKKRYKFMKEDMQLPANDEARAIEYLEAAIRYQKIKRGFVWQMTTSKKVEELCQKYKVRVVTISGYHRCVPQEAIDEMKKYLDIYRKVTKGKEPNIRLIIDDVEHVKDHIILAGSPFGNWDYVLGAWDKEVEIMDKLFLRD